MRNVEKVTLEVVQKHEESVRANVRLGGYEMPLATSFETYRVVLTSEDLTRLFMVAEFGKHTRGHTSKIADVLAEMLDNERVASFATSRVDLRTTLNLEPIAVCSDLERPLTIIDGNHRSIAHFLMWKTIEDVAVYVAVHPRINQEWLGYIPSRAKC